MCYKSAYCKNACLIVLVMMILFGSNSHATAKEYDYLLNKSYAELIPLYDTTVFQRLKYAPKAAFDSEIAAIRKLSEKHDDEQLYMETLLSEWYHKKINNGYSNYLEGIGELWKLMDIAKKKKLDKYVILLRHELGVQHFYEAHDYNQAFTLFLTNYPEITKVSSSVMPNKKSIILHTGNVYYNFGDHINAKKYIQIADTISNFWRLRVSIQCKNTLGLIYRKQGNYDSAKYYFEQCIEIARGSTEEIWVAIASGNIGIGYHQQGRYEEAIPLLKIDADECLKFGSYDNGINSLIKLTDAYIRTGRLAMAQQEIERGWQFVDSMRDKLKHIPGLFNATADLYIASGKYKIAHTYRDSAAFYQDSLLRRDNTLQLARVQGRIRQEVHEKELQALNVEKDLIRNSRNALIAILVLLSIIAYLFINRQRLKHRANKAILTADKKLAENKLKNAVQELDNYTSRLQEKNALIEKSASEIERLQTKLEHTNDKKDQSETLQQLYASTILTDEEWDEFKLLFDKVHSGYLHRLKEKMPELSPADTRFIVLTKLNMTNKEMAGILGVQPDTIRSYKHRLRKKFDLPEDADMRGFVENI